MDKDTKPGLSLFFEATTNQELPVIRPCPFNPDKKLFPRALDEYICRRADRKLNVSLLVAPHHRHMRIVDYRLGQYKLKCTLFDEMAARENIKKIFTLVEKQDSNSWRTVGFSKEAVIPSYFRNADAYIMSRVYDNEGRPITGGIAKLVHEKQVEFGPPEPISKKPSGIKETFIDDPETINQIMHLPEVSALYHPFGKGIKFPHFILEVRQGQRRLWVGAETNDAFGHAKLDILTPPSNVRERRILAWMVQRMLEELAETSDVACVFAITLVDDVSCGQVLIDAGFKESGQLTRHLQTEDGRLCDALMWYVRIAPKGNKSRQPEAVFPMSLPKADVSFDFEDDEDESSKANAENDDEDL